MVCLCVLCMLLLLILSYQHLFARRRDLSGELARSVRHYMTRIWNGTLLKLLILIRLVQKCDPRTPSVQPTTVRSTPSVVGFRLNGVHLRG